MSTRAYLTIVDEAKNIQMAAFYPSSAYPSYLGLQILDAIQNSAYPQFIGELREEYPEEVETVEGITRDWYVKTAKNKDEFFHDYAYELNGAKQELTIFHFGAKALTIPYDQIPLYRFIFENEDSLYYPLCLDERTLTLRKDFYKEVRDIVKQGGDISYFQRVIDENPNVMYISDGRMKDPWAMHGDSFNKEIRDTAGGSLKIHVSLDYGRAQLYAQTPFVRSPIPHKPIRSAAAAEKLLAEIVRDRPEDIRATIAIFKDLAKYSESVKEIYANDDIPLDDRADQDQKLRLDMLAQLKGVQEKHLHILGDNDRLLEREVADVCHRNYRAAYQRAEEQQKSSLDGTLKDAVQRAGSEQKQSQEPTLTWAGR